MIQINARTRNRADELRMKKLTMIVLGALKYGTPEWRDRYVAMYHPGADGLAGTAKLIEPDVRFQNRFGAI